MTAVATDCTSCERMAEAETEIKNLKGLTGDMDRKVDQLMLSLAFTKNLLIVVNIVSPIFAGLVVYLLTK